jgi:hypothetical protein
VPVISIPHRSHMGPVTLSAWPAAVARPALSVPRSALPSRRENWAAAPNVARWPRQVRRLPVRVRFHPWLVLTWRAPCVRGALYSKRITRVNQPKHVAAPISATPQIASASHIVVTFNFRFGAHDGRKSGIAACPNRADRRHGSLGFC